MDRKQAESIIGECLNVIALICESFKPDFEHCSLYITKETRSAVMWAGDDDNNTEYALNYYHRKEGVEE